MVTGLLAAGAPDITIRQERGEMGDSHGRGEERRTYKWRVAPIINLIVEMTFF